MQRAGCRCLAWPLGSIRAMTVMVTGASGPVGHALVPLLARKDEVRAAIRDPDAAEPLRALGAKVTIGRLDEADDLAEVLRGCSRSCIWSADPTRSTTTPCSPRTTGRPCERWPQLERRGCGGSCSSRFREPRRRRRCRSCEPGSRRRGRGHVGPATCRDPERPGRGAGSLWFAATVAGALQVPPIVWGSGRRRVAPVAVGDLAATLAIADDLDEDLAGIWGLEGPDMVAADEVLALLAGPAARPEHLEGETARSRLSSMLERPVRSPRRRRSHARRRARTHPMQPSGSASPTPFADAMRASPRRRRPTPRPVASPPRWATPWARVDDGVGIVRLDRPPANAIDLQLATELNDAIREAADRDEIGSLVLWGGGRIFAAGADIKAMAEWGPDEVRPTVDALGAASDLLAEIPKVSIAAVNGFALGGGLELALGADLRFLADDATVGQPEITLGVIPGAGGRNA